MLIVTFKLNLYTQLLSGKHRLSTYMLAAQLYLDLSKVNKDNYAPAEKEFKDLYLMYIQKISSYCDDPTRFQWIIESFISDFKTYKQEIKNEMKFFSSNPIQSCTMSYLCLFEMTKAGVSQIEENHSESFNFKTPSSKKDKIKMKLIQLMILKYLRFNLILPLGKVNS